MNKRVGLRVMLIKDNKSPFTGSSYTPTVEHLGGATVLTGTKTSGRLEGVCCIGFTVVITNRLEISTFD